MSAKHNLTCRKGNTFNLQFAVSTDNVPWNLTSYTITMTVKPFVNSTTTIVSATTTNGLITITNAANGKVTINIPAATTANFTAGRHEYDVVFNSGTVVTTLFEGKFVVTEGPTV